MNRLRRILQGMVPLGIAGAQSVRAIPVSVDYGTSQFGVDQDTFSPSEYGNYLALNSAVFVCARLRATLLASLDLKLYKTKGKKQVETGFAYELFQKVNPFWTRSRLIEMSELSLCTWGQCFWFLEYQGGIIPREIWWVKPTEMTVVPSSKGYISHFIYRPSNGDPEVRMDSREVVWLRYPNPIDQFSGLSPLASARVSADTHSAALRSNYNMFRNGINLGGLVVPKSSDKTFTEKQAKEVETFIDQRFKGIDKAHRWGILRAEVDFKTFNMTPKDAEFLGSLKWTLEDVARAYGIPQDLIGGQRTFENISAAERHLWSNTLIPEATFLATEITEQVLPRFLGEVDYAEFDHSAVEPLQEDKAKLWERVSGEMDRGSMTINEWRAEQNREPVPWGDVWWSPAGLKPIESLEAFKKEAEAAAAAAQAAAEAAAKAKEDQAKEGEAPQDPNDEEAARLFGGPFPRPVALPSAARNTKLNGSS